MTTVAIAKRAPARIAKGKLGVYFAWGAFSKRDGQTFTDSHGDQIPDEEIVGAALSLAKSAQLGHEHDGTITGSVPLVMPLAEDIQAALEITSPHAGLVVGFTPTAEVAKSIDASIEAGEPWQMSIEGVALAELVKATVAKSADAADVAKAEHKRTLRKLCIDKIDLVRAAAHGVGTSIAIAKRADASTAGDAARQVAAAQVDKSLAGAKKQLKAAIARHQRHMDGTESTSDESQRKLMDEIEGALAELGDEMAKAAMACCATCGCMLAPSWQVCPMCGAKIAGAVDMAKRAPAMTDPTNGHAHLIWDAEEADGSTSYEVMPGAEYGHSHPFVRLADGSISIGEAAGHTHTVSTAGDATMADDLAKSIQATQADAKKAADQTAAVLALPVEQFAFAKRLAGAELTAYLAKSATERAELAKPVHVAKSGEVYYSTDDARLVSMAKAHDATLERLAKAEGDAQAATIAKAAAALPHTKAAGVIVKAIHGGALTAEERTEALAGLATIDASIAKVCQPIGKGGAVAAEGSAAAQLDAMANEIAKAKGVSFAKAYDAALETPAGAALYARAEAEKRTAAGN